MAAIKILSIISQKGGVGKSTTAVHIASAAVTEGLKVLLVDADAVSRSAKEWASERDLNQPLVVAAYDEDDEAPPTEETLIEKIKIFVEAGEDEGFDLIVIDCPPYLRGLPSRINHLSDFTLLPIKPNFNDIRTLTRTIHQIEGHYSILLSQCKPRVLGLETAKTKEARELLTHAGMNVCPVQITLRESFSDSLNDGSSVLEYEPKGKATQEVLNLWSWVRKTIFK